MARDGYCAIGCRVFLAMLHFVYCCKVLFVWHSRASWSTTIANASLPTASCGATFIPLYCIPRIFHTFGAWVGPSPSHLPPSSSSSSLVALAILLSLWGHFAGPLWIPASMLTGLPCINKVFHSFIPFESLVPLQVTSSECTSAHFVFFAGYACVGVILCSSFDSFSIVVCPTPHLRCFSVFVSC